MSKFFISGACLVIGFILLQADFGVGAIMFGAAAVLIVLFGD